MTGNRENRDKPLQQMETDRILDKVHKIRQLLKDVRWNETDYSDSTGQDQDNTRRVGNRHLNTANTDARPSSGTGHDTVAPTRHSRA
jgi:hypothetical protein